MKWIKWIGLGLVVIVVLFVGVGLVLPNEYSLERSITIDATPAQVHALVGDLERWDEWTPFKDNDPTVVTTLGDRTTGVGASQTWTDQTGGGSLTFTESTVEGGIAYDMEFLLGDSEDAEPVASSAAMRYRQVDGGTEVTWSMDGSMPVPVLGGYLAITMKPAIAGLFDQGLEKLKKKAEAEPLPVEEELEPVAEAGEVASG